jgi:outer membrane receptor protein involved in Fe transport
MTGRHIVFVAGCAIAAGSAGRAVAQDGATAAVSTPVSKDEGDIVVTALKRATTVQTTPIAITAVTGEQLAAKGITDTYSLARTSPGLVVREGSLSGARLTIRNIRAAGEPTVGLYFDETPVPGSAGVNSDAGGTTPDLRLFDVDRVEVLRGPQGTLYGSSSMAGAVRLIFAKPELAGFEAKFAGQMSAVQGGEPGFQNQAAINVPVITDVLGIRAVGFYQVRPGYVDNLRLDQQDVNTQTTRGGRLMVRFRPAPSLTIDGLAYIQDSRGTLNDYKLSLGAYNQSYEAQQPLRDRFRLFSGTATWDIGPVTLVGTGSHAYRNFNYSYDFSDFFRTFGANFPVGSALNTAFNAQAPSVANSPQVTKTDSAELRLSGNGGGPLQYTFGFFYSDRDGAFASNIVRASPVNGQVLPVGPSTLLGQRVITDKLKQTAGYGEVTYAVTDALSLTGGIRYFDYDRRVTGVVTVPNALVGFVAAPATDQSNSEHGWLYKANASYRLARDVMLYATAASGQRPGGINQNIALPANLQQYRSDHLWNYEAGVKSQFLDRALTINVDIFQIDWDDIQTTGTLPNTNFAFIANAGRARARGVEVETAVTPYRGLQFQLSGSYIDAQLRENQSNQSLLAAGLKGDDIPSVPKVTVQGGAQYGWALGSRLRADLRADAYYNSSTWTEFRRTNEFQRRLPAYTLVSLRAGIGAADGNWTASLFVNNLLDDDSVVSKLSANVYGSLDNVRAISNVPRTIGIDLTKSF